MTARGLIEQIFSRRQAGVESNLRYITPAQLELLRKLVDEDRAAAAIGELWPGFNDGFVWLPGDGNHYIVTQDAGRRRRSILWLRVQSAETPSLF